jgi:hypothetical protein
VVTAQNYHVTAGGCAATFFWQRAISSYERFEFVHFIEGWCQRDKSSGLKGTDGSIDVLST